MIAPNISIFDIPYGQAAQMIAEQKAEFAEENSRNDDRLIHEAAIFAGLIIPGERLGQAALEGYRIVLREMRAQTECARLALAMAAHLDKQAQFPQVQQ